MGANTSSKSVFINYDQLIASDLKAGDLIEINRGAYRHWALFAAKDDYDQYWCFHVIEDEKYGKNPLFKAKKPFIRKDTLKNILNDTPNDMSSMARINNQESEAVRRNVKELPISSVLIDLEAMKDQKVKFNASQPNSEYFATAWKYGKGWSVAADGEANMRAFTSASSASSNMWT